MLKSMESMTGKLSNLWPWRKRNTENIDTPGPSHEERLNRVIGPYESMFFKIQSLLIWEEPVLSTIFIIGSNLLFWLVVTWEFRFYSVACLTILFVFVYNLWVEEIWPEIRVPSQGTPDSEDWTPVHPSVLSAPEISHHLNAARAYVVNLYEKACKLRHDQPGVFCAVSCGCLFTLLLVGRTVSGVWLLYLLLNSVLVLPGIFLYLVPPDTYKYVSEASKNFGAIFIPQNQGTNVEPLEAELIPEESPENIALLSLSLVTGAVADGAEDEEIASLLPAGDLPVPDDNGDSSTLNSLTPALGMMPSHEDESLDGLDFLSSELDPSVPQQSDDGIRFRHRHFNGNDGSSSDEESLGQGLNFPDPGVAPAESGISIPRPLAEFLASSALENVASSVAQTLAGAVGSLNRMTLQQQQQPQRRHSEDDDDDDFEIINQDDLPSIS